MASPKRRPAASAPALPKARAPVPASADHRELYAGLIRLHVLHHASKEAVYGLAMIDELGHHSYELSAGTLYPILLGLEQKVVRAG